MRWRSVNKRIFLLFFFSFLLCGQTLLVNLRVEGEDLVVTGDRYWGFQERGICTDEDVGGLTLPEFRVWDGGPILFQGEAVHDVHIAQNTTGGIDFGCWHTSG